MVYIIPTVLAPLVNHMERLRNKEIGRRYFLGLAGRIAGAGTVVAAVAPFSNLLPSKAYAAPDEMEAAVLGEYLARIEPIKQKFLPVVEENDIFSGLKKLSTDVRLEDFEQYFPMYWGAESQYQTPWPLLWIMHTHETTVSRDPTADVGRYKGAKQRDFQYYNNAVATEAARGWSALRWLPQRFIRGSRWQTTDYEEILFAAWKLNRDAEVLRKSDVNLSFEDSILDAQYQYCAKEFAKQRIEKYREIAPLFALE